jgi:fimbrial chaperone protein
MKFWKSKSALWSRFFFGKTVFAFLMVAILSGYAHGANFDIKPVKIYFDAQTRIEKLTLKNLSDENFRLQLKAYIWTQGKKGEDLYEETNDIIMFPKILSLKRGEERIVRVGTNVSPGEIEKTYRIYIEQMPPAEDEAKDTHVRMLVKIGVPLFISPLKKDEKGDVESVSLKNGKAEVKVANNGNLHFAITGINVMGLDDKGKTIYSTELGGWYLLQDKSRVYEASVPEETCNSFAKLRVAMKTKDFTRTGEINVERGMCRPNR